MTEITRCDVVTGEYLGELVNRVNVEIGHGWQPVGQPFQITTTSANEWGVVQTTTKLYWAIVQYGTK